MQCISSESPVTVTPSHGQELSVAFMSGNRCNLVAEQVMPTCIRFWLLSWAVTFRLIFGAKQILFMLAAVVSDAGFSPPELV